MEDNFSYSHLMDKEKVVVEKYKLLELVTEFVGHFHTQDLISPGYELIEEPPSEVRKHMSGSEQLLLDIFNQLETYVIAQGGKALKEQVFKVEVPSHYAGNQDVIDYFAEQVPVGNYISTMKFNVLKYTTRLGKKDGIEKEAEKIYHYLSRIAKVVYGDKWEDIIFEEGEINNEHN